MKDFPIPIREFILALTDEILSPGYMLVKENDELTYWGGDLDSYGLRDLTEGLRLSEEVPFLAGLFPLTTNSIFLPKVQTTTDVYADVYLFTRDEGTWILLLDATSDSVRRQTMQQKLYNSRLQAREIANEREDLLRANLNLEQMVRERTAELARTVARLQKELEEKDTRKLP
jgi:hypothetical protein